MDIPDTIHTGAGRAEQARGVAANKECKQARSEKEQESEVSTIVAFHSIPKIEGLLSCVIYVRASTSAVYQCHAPYMFDPGARPVSAVLSCAAGRWLVCPRARLFRVALSLLCLCGGPAHLYFSRWDGAPACGPVCAAPVFPAQPSRNGKAAQHADLCRWCAVCSARGEGKTGQHRVEMCISAGPGARCALYFCCAQFPGRSAPPSDYYAPNIPMAGALLGMLSACVCGADP